MTPAHTDSPLRRSEANVFRDGAQNQRPQHNDDDEERRQARRRTLLSAGSEKDANTTSEQSETLKKCLAIFHDNKLSRDNAWSLSLIDTVSSLLERHHKSLNNFTVAGSSLEASSKVYGLRVDCVHTDVLRMSAGLSARKFRGNGEDDDDDGVATGGEGSADPNSSAGTGIDPAATIASETAAQKKQKSKRQRKPVTTVTKNKETLNARLDTVPLQDPVFGKLNCIVGSINASNRLMNNMLHTVNAELRLRMTHTFWESNDSDENCDYTIPVPFEDSPDGKILPCEKLCKLDEFENLLLRPINSGYVITDTPEPIAEDKNKDAIDVDRGYNDDSSVDGGGCSEIFVGNGDPTVAFDMDAACDPMPSLHAYAPVLAVDDQYIDDCSVAEQNALGHCRALRKSAIVIEDLRPVDSTSKLEYSYRPVEKISQFWAGPSHWRFKRKTQRISSACQTGNSQQIEYVGRALNPRNRKVNALQSKKRSKLQFSTQIHDALFLKLDSKYKLRKTNFLKKWDQKKLRLPTDLQLSADKLVTRRFFAPAFSAYPIEHVLDDYYDDTDTPSINSHDQNFNADDDDGNIADMDHNGFSDYIAGEAERLDSSVRGTELGVTGNNPMNETVLEIATDFEGAPRQVTKIIVPFAKRAKVIDMKNLKRSCAQLISHQLRKCTTSESQILRHPVKNHEKYAEGCASFQELYDKLPTHLTQTMAEGLTTSIAFYSVLHLANDFSYRLIPQNDLEDFKIRQVLEN